MVNPERPTSCWVHVARCSPGGAAADSNALLLVVVPRPCTSQENQYTLSFLGAIDDTKDVAKSGEVGADSATALATTGPSAKRMRVP